MTQTIMTTLFKKQNISCSNCNLSELCLPMGLDNTELKQLDQLMRQHQSRQPLRRKEHLFDSGDPLTHLYAIRSGCIKTVLQSTAGDEQILGFHLPGELLGLDALENNQHTCTAIALTDTRICQLPFEKMNQICGQIPAFHHQIQHLIGRKISQDHTMMLLLGKKNAEERLLSFLLSLSTRFQQRGFSAHDFNLNMSRHDIANYLGLAVETISRLLKRFQTKGLISVQHRNIQLHDLEKLKSGVSFCKGNPTCNNQDLHSRD
ncbi:MAG: fumarate/nitrate reduction transcriptional regulator Fnr [Gammaproteobacteria bacterium]|nr:fumarate/nitrate reduction transcriptional regulator Fnr [Gammaproteobacteria bacterium]